MESRWMLYGATGFTGRLLAKEAVARGLRPLLAGRNVAKLAPLAEQLGVPFVQVGLEEPIALRKALDGVELVFHAAGPFVRTSRPMVDACVEVGAHYLDITGELPVFEAVFARHEEARRRGVALLPGMGLDVIPSDCLAMHVAQRVRGASELEIALAAVGQISQGTAKSILGMVGEGAQVRREGRLQRVALGRVQRRVQWGERSRRVIAAPLGDLHSAYRSTGIPNITTYVAVSSRTAQVLNTGWPLVAAGFPLLRALLASTRVREGAEHWLERVVSNPDMGEASDAPSYVYARAAGEGEEASSWLQTMNGYRFTAVAGIRAVERVLATRPRGALSPAQALGKDFLLELPDTLRWDSA